MGKDAKYIIMVGLATACTLVTTAGANSGNHILSIIGLVSLSVVTIAIYLVDNQGKHERNHIAKNNRRQVRKPLR